MKSILQQSLRTTLAVLLLAGAWQLAYHSAGMPAVPQRLVAGALTVAALAALFAVLFRRVRSEDRIARLEAELCREQNARSQADEALAEADLLLARLSARKPPRAFGQAEGKVEGLMIAQLAHIRRELAQVQQTALDPACAGRLARARDRLEQIAQVMHSAARAAERR